MNAKELKINIADREAAYKVGDASDKATLGPIIEKAKAQLAELEKEDDPEPPKDKPKASPAKKTTAKKPRAKRTNTPKKEKPKPANSYDWLKKITGYEKLKKVHYQDLFFYILKLDEDGEFTIRGISNPLKKGDALLLNKEGYPITFLTENSIDRHTSPFVEMVTKESYEKLKKEIENKNNEIQELKGKVVLQKENQGNPVEIEGTANENGKTTAKKATSCGLGTGQASKAGKGEMPAPALAWLTGMVEAWKDYKYHGKIHRIYLDKETNKILVKIIWYDPIVRRLKIKLKVNGNPELYYLCLGSGRLTVAKIDKRLQVLVGKEELDELYSTRNNYTQCRKLIRRAYAACKDGKCSKEDRALYSQFYHECGDDVMKDKNIKFVKAIHAETRRNWNPDKDDYLTTFKRTYKALQEKAKNV
jgi:hypothetical protein